MNLGSRYVAAHLCQRRAIELDRADELGQGRVTRSTQSRLGVVESFGDALGDPGRQQGTDQPDTQRRSCTNHRVGQSLDRRTQHGDTPTLPHFRHGTLDQFLGGRVAVHRAVVVQQRDAGGAVLQLLDAPLAAHAGDGRGGHDLAEGDGAGHRVQDAAGGPGAHLVAGDGPQAQELLAALGGCLLQHLDVHGGAEHLRPLGDVGDQRVDGPG